MSSPADCLALLETVTDPFSWQWAIYLTKPWQFLPWMEISSHLAVKKRNQTSQDTSHLILPENEIALTDVRRAES